MLLWLGAVPDESRAQTGREAEQNRYVDLTAE